MSGSAVQGSRWARVAPGLLVVSPLVAFSFQGDERRNIYYNAERFGSSPLEIARQAVDEIDVFLRLGNFRPLGRFLDYSEHTLVFEAAEATGLAPHVVHGLVRVAMVAVLVVVTLRLVRCVVPPLPGSQETDRHWFGPAAVAAVLVAGGAESPLTHFPFLFISAAVWVIAVPQYVVRLDRDVNRRRVSVWELAICGGIGAASAMFFDLAYVVGPFSVVVLLAGAVSRRVSLGVVARSAAARRVLALGIGFLLVFVPVRMAIAAECGDGGCYSGSDLSLESDAVALVGDRVLTANPAAAWSFNDDLATERGVGFGLRDLFSNSLLVLVVLGLVVLAARASRQGRDAPSLALRDGVAVMLVGSALVVLPATLVSFSKLLQVEQRPVGEAWRDTLLAQMGWAVFVIGLVGWALGVSDAALPGARALLRGALVIGLCGACVASVLANERLARVDRRDQVAILSNQISMSTIDFDLSEAGNDQRCLLIARYSELEPDPDAWTGGPMLRRNLDQLAIGRHGRPYCDPPEPGAG